MSAEAVNCPYDTIATLAGVAKGTVTRVMRDLAEHGHLSTTGEARTLHDKGRLAREWADAYGRELAPRLQTATLSGPVPAWWRGSWDGADGTLAGGAALAELGAPLKNTVTVVYGTPPWATLRRAARLRSDGEPNVVLRERFWSATLDHGRWAHPLLAWADAMAIGDPREIDVATELTTDPATLL